MKYNEIPTELMEQLPIEKALNVLGFIRDNKYGNLVRKWGPIEIMAGPWLMNWMLFITIESCSPRTIYIPQEVCVGINMRPIDVLAIIYSVCRSVFNEEEPPKDLMWGKIEMQRYYSELTHELANRPTLWAEKDFFRFCITYISKINDWSSEDYQIEFSHSDGQLRLKAKDVVLYCPAIGTFNGTLKMPARQLFRSIPKRFLSSTVLIQVLKEQKASIGSHIITAHWVENPLPEDNFV